MVLENDNFLVLPRLNSKNDGLKRLFSPLPPPVIRDEDFLGELSSVDLIKISPSTISCTKKKSIINLATNITKNKEVAHFTIGLIISFDHPISIILTRC
jgi:hypothetical protein